MPVLGLNRTQFDGTRASGDDRLGFDLDLPARIEEAGDDDHRAGRPDVAEDLPVHLTDDGREVRADEVLPRAHDVRGLGAAGYMKDHMTELYYRDARQLTIVEGTSQVQLGLIGRGVLNKDLWW